MYISSIRVENIRSFASACVAFQFPGRENGSTYYPNVNVLLGDNGSGKTAILQAIALACLGPTLDSSGLVPYYLIRQGAEKASVTANVIFHPEDFSQDNTTENIEIGSQIIRDGENELMKWLVGKSTTISQKMNSTETATSPAFLVFAYGATRRVETGDLVLSSMRKSRRLRYQRVAGLFEDYITLTPLSFWLPKVKSRRFAHICNIIDQLLPEGTRISRKREGETTFFEQGQHLLPFGALSDGYRSLLGWIGDMLYYLQEVCPPGKLLTDLCGVVMVDEVDLHLHPEWQLKIIEQVSTTFPNLQFIFTTHSPIIAGTLDDQSLFILEQEKINQASTIRQTGVSVYGLETDQVLSSVYFNLQSTQPQGFRKELRELSNRAAQGDKDAALLFMQKLNQGGHSKQKVG